MAFVWAGFALLVRPTPGGGARRGSRASSIGPLGNEWVPKAAVVLLVIVAVIWIPSRRSRLGLSIYAIGSNRLAAFRSGVPVGRTKVARLRDRPACSRRSPGCRLTASTGIGTPVPGPYTLVSVAAVVLGGVSLAGGRGGVFGPIVAVLVLQLIRTDMTFLNVDTNLAFVAQGVILIGVVMSAASSSCGGRGHERCSDAATGGTSAETWRNLFRDRPVDPAIGLLARPGRRHRARRPGHRQPVLGRRHPARSPCPWRSSPAARPDDADGRDRPVGRRRRLDGRVRDRDARPQPGACPWRSSSRSRSAALAGPHHGHRRRRVPGPPADHDPGHELRRPRARERLAAQMVQTGAGVPPALRTLGSGTFLGVAPSSLLVFVPVAALILFGLRRTGYGRLLYAIGDNPVAARLSGARAWQVLIVLYVISAAPGGDRRPAPVRPDEHRERFAGRLVAPAVGRGRGHRRDVDHGRPGRLRRRRSSGRSS